MAHELRRGGCAARAISGGASAERHVQQLPASAVGRNGDSIVVVPVWFHVVHDNGIGNVSDADVDRQIRIWNDSFAGDYGGFDQGFRFELAGITRPTTPNGSTPAPALTVSAR